MLLVVLYGDCCIRAMSSEIGCVNHKYMYVLRVALIGGHPKGINIGRLLLLATRSSGQCGKVYSRVLLKLPPELKRREPAKGNFHFIYPSPY